ncbi:MAG: four helix bundle protein [Aggregatilineales bacterium]
MQNYRNLEVWQRSHQIVLRVYKITDYFPQDERFGLISQIRRSAVSVPANIAEGSVRSSDKDFARFLYIAMGSNTELEYHLFLSCELGFLDFKIYEDISSEINRIGRMLNSFIKKLKGK